ncbi:HK97-gp10 family putative phage morphogenesis protein [Streptococcus pneumoniae]|uniref:HK97-gp10 family putative phage morphogenesis protein n=1 Tax=Streptococcus pneumoniae TaxID=1313 RepID=UPI000B6F25D0|nr:HK97-gp10 family putative phage morphogenesis protein [Streptococcus pneumoniae]SNP68046.1 phage protein, HK97 gp10 family [Streptococcus pneumoniae]
MAGGMKIDWKGVEQLTMTIKGAGTKVREQSGKVVRNNAEKLKSKAQAKAPEDTGFLKTQIKTSYPGELEAHIDDEAAYAGYQEYGTRFQPGKPHLRPALREIEPTFKQDMADVMKGAFED